jgi:hypothetical protein
VQKANRDASPGRKATGLHRVSWVASFDTRNSGGIAVDKADISILIGLFSIVIMVIIALRV